MCSVLEAVGGPHLPDGAPVDAKIAPIHVSLLVPEQLHDVLCPARRDLERLTLDPWGVGCDGVTLRPDAGDASSRRAGGNRQDDSQRDPAS